MDIIEVTRGSYMISTDASKLDVKKIHWFLSELSYWAQNRPLEIVQRSIDHSLNFGVYYGEDQVGFARVVTDYTTFAWLCDVIITPEHRGNGLGKWLVETIINHPDLTGLRRFLLATRDAHELYRQYGDFKQLANPERWMEKTRQ